ncbi:MAG TPA: PfaD family polyunsaturated fatty acid/polyketide biosynthesis protein [Vicinamibacterales bacterium]|jgi:PfaD family protein
MLTETRTIAPLGAWTPTTEPAHFTPRELASVIPHVRAPIHIVRHAATGHVGVATAGTVDYGAVANGSALDLLASLPGLYPEWLGDRSFLDTHGVRFPYVAGEMANGIATPAMVVAMARANMLGFLGTAGLPVDRIARAIAEVASALGASAGQWGANLIHTPYDPAHETQVVELLLRQRVRRMSASAYMALKPCVVRYASSGLHVDAAGRIQRVNHVFAKVSHADVARQFLEPAPADMLAGLVRGGQLTAEEARLAREVPVAEDLTIEADSGGHTDNRPLTALFPTIQAVRDAAVARYRYTRPIRLGAAGGLGTPSALAAAFNLGAAYVLTGSINQSAVESGLSPAGKALLARAEMTDVAMAPAADMFEMGVKVQVLKRGTLFAPRAAWLYDLYQRFDSLEALPAEVRARLETQVFRAPIEEVWEHTVRFWTARHADEVERARRDARHRMALVFRWYLGKSSEWSITGEASRIADYQIWCGPAMGAFNAWVAGSSLEPLATRHVVQIALNLLEGAAVLTRAQQLRSHGVPVPAEAFEFRPRLLC